MKTIIILIAAAAALFADQVTLQWDANTDADLAGYSVYYGTKSRGSEVSPDRFFYMDCIRGLPKSQTTVTLNKVLSGSQYYFAVTAHDTAGNESNFSNEVSLSSGIEVNGNGKLKITEVEIERPFPNPFNPASSINFTLAQSAKVSCSIYNSQGQLVEKLVDKRLGKGGHSLRWDASKAPSGTYYYRLRAGDFTHSDKLVLIK